MAFIIDTYNKFNGWDRAHSIYKFELNGVPYAIKEVISFSNSFEFPTSIMEDRDPKTYRLYPTYEEALTFVKYMKSLNK